MQIINFLTLDLLLSNNIMIPPPALNCLNKLAYKIRSGPRINRTHLQYAYREHLLNTLCTV